MWVGRRKHFNRSALHHICFPAHQLQQPTANPAMSDGISELDHHWCMSNCQQSSLNDLLIFSSWARSKHHRITINLHIYVLMSVRIFVIHLTMPMVRSWSHGLCCMPYTPFTQSVRPLYLPCATIKLTRSPLDAQWRQHGCLGRSKVVHRTFNNRHDRHQVLNVFKTVAEGSPRRLVAQRSLRWGRGDAAASPWLQNGCTMVGQWSPRNICVLLQSSAPQIGRRFCLPCASSSVLWTMTVTTTLPPFGDHGDAWASMSMVLPSFCVLYATCCASAFCL